MASIIGFNDEVEVGFCAYVRMSVDCYAKSTCEDDLVSGRFGTFLIVSQKMTVTRPARPFAVIPQFLCIH